MSGIDLFSSLGWPRSVVVVADSSALLQDLRHSARGTVGILGELARLGFVVSPPSVILETEKHLPRMVAIDVPEPLLCSRWNEYKQWIHVVDVDPDEAHGIKVRALRTRDPRDVPVVAAAQAQHGQAVILTGDLDFISLGLAPANWLMAARSVKEVAIVDATELVGLVVIRGLITGMAHTFKAASAGEISARVLLAGLAAAFTWIAMEKRLRVRVAGGLTTIVMYYGHLLLARADHTRRLQLTSPMPDPHPQG